MQPKTVRYGHRALGVLLITSPDAGDNLASCVVDVAISAPLVTSYVWSTIGDENTLMRTDDRCKNVSCGIPVVS